MNGNAYRKSHPLASFCRPIPGLSEFIWWFLGFLSLRCIGQNKRYVGLSLILLSCSHQLGQESGALILVNDVVEVTIIFLSLFYGVFLTSSGAVWPTPFSCEKASMMTRLS